MFSLLKISTLLFLLFSCPKIIGQNVMEPKSLKTEKKGLVYQKENNLQLRAHTNGIALGFMLGRIKKYTLTEYYTLEIGFLKHPRQYKQAISSSALGSRPYHFGKINSFIQSRIGYKRRHYLSEKAQNNGIAIGYDYELAAVLGMEKPYYLVTTYQDGENESIKYRAGEDNSIFLDENRIIGADNFFRGFNEMRIVPGISGKAGLVFSWGAYDRYSRSVETGVMVDVFTRPAMLMATEQDMAVFFNVYLNFILGWRK